jgi:predicted RNA-binding protein
LGSRTILRGGEEMFFLPDVVSFYSSVMEEWKSEKMIALLMGCSQHKPYSASFMHKKTIGLLVKHGLDEFVQQYIIGEPLVVVPREWEEKYPAAHYEFPPEMLGEGGREVFVERLKRFLSKAISHHKHFIVFAPNHHKKIILAASEGLFSPITVPYNLYKLPMLLKTIKEVLDGKV